MQTRKYQADDERSILTGMIVNDRVLGRIHAHVRNAKKPFRARWCNIISDWCLSYFGKHHQAPRAAIQILFRDYAGKTEDEDTVALLEKFLVTLSEDHRDQDINEDYLIDVAARYFNQVRMERLVQSVEADLTKRDVDSAHQKVVGFNPINLATTAMVDVLTDTKAIQHALSDEENEVLVQYPRALGGFFGTHLQRDGLIAFMAPEKRGKSWWLIDVAWRAAVVNRRKTLFYSVGDMSQRQMMRRFIARAIRRPLAGGVEYSIPKRLRVGEDGVARVVGDVKTTLAPVSMKEGVEAMKEVFSKLASKTSLLRMRCTSNSTTRVLDIRSDIEELAREGWVPDVVVVDYADILAPENAAVEDYRHQINDTWKALRRLSQDYHNLVVTATQTDAQSYEQDLLRRKNFSEDKRKFAHVTGMVGINQNEDEKQIGVYRLNWILLREGVYFESKCVTTAGCLGMTNPAIKSQSPDNNDEWK